MSRKPWVGGNWKCNGTVKSVEDLCKMMEAAYPLAKNTDVIVCPSPVHMSMVAAKLPKGMVAAQNVSVTGNGAFTGETSVEMLQDLGFSTTLVGHSERRSRYGDTDEIVADKVERCQKAGVTAILCIGENLTERKAGQTMEVIKRQVAACLPKISDWKLIVIAYEPVWAIGTGEVATKEQAQEAHEELRKFLKEKVSEEVASGCRIVYGGSVNEENCASLIGQPDVDGFLVGGASLKPGFIKIIECTSK